MFDPKSISLIQALDMSIKRIIENFDSLWLIDSVIPSVENTCICSDQKLFEKYERVLMPDDHRFTEIFICIDGSCAIQVEDRVFEVKKGSTCIILPGTLHNELPLKDGNHIAIWVTVDMNRCMLHLSGKHDDTGFYTVEGQLLQSDYYYNLLLSHIKQELTDKGKFTYEMIKTYLLQMLVHALKEMKAKDEISDHGRLWKESIILDVQNYIEKNHYKPIRLEDVSQEVCISENYLNTLFKSIAGKTIIQYIAEYKIDKAKNLLKNSNDTIQGIASRLGYYDQYHFSKAFKKATGISPTQYRKV